MAAHLCWPALFLANVISIVIYTMVSWEQRNLHCQPRSDRYRLVTMARGSAACRPPPPPGSPDPLSERPPWLFAPALYAEAAQRNWSVAQPRSRRVGMRISGIRCAALVGRSELDSRNPVTLLRDERSADAFTGRYL